VEVTVDREGESLNFTLTRKIIHTPVATGRMLEGNVGLVTIRNFNSKCADESIKAVKKLCNEGAQAIIFDVRNNPGGYQAELVALLDYLLPEGKLFRSVDYTGKEETDWSDEACLDIPMAVLVNGESYSAAEFFAAALDEYDWATVVGQQTCGKGYFQVTYQFSDGSVVGLSIGKYFTPIKGISLAEVGGLTPDVVVDVDDKTAALIYSGLLEPEEDPQIQAALEALKNP
jgi:carboxyl-terminal processing protease